MDLINKVKDRTQTKLKWNRRTFHGFEKLPVEIQDLIIQYAIPDFIPTIDIAYRHNCYQPLHEKPLRWKVTGIPQTALNLQLVSRQVRLQARSYMFKACGGLQTISYPLSCGCLTPFQGVFKHTKAIYILQDAFRDMPVDPITWSESLDRLHHCMRRSNVKTWARMLSIKDDLYLSNYSRDWNLATITDQFAPMVLERWAPTFRAWVEGDGDRVRTFRQRLAMMIELNIRFLAPRLVRCCSSVPQ